MVICDKYWTINETQNNKITIKLKHSWTEPEVETKWNCKQNIFDRSLIHR